ncbi:30S ribosomal protein S8e [Hyperthermus butylicus]|uniref:Small ribosomal subunit protein eS8 n=1 Tax=Hyperthermus butylicus (strain DSM 5456 / JCM 9403 / PLM1-5) TaxID=415426 RepID=RS8E_HYPBU|nr:30S ribosomal protein S8e [Hyperthermus butylicus]A2BK08.1 RecName: Full=Small ribosomal subunit protein eS8; AltName: Full=30S ribosomal protein S8e [Hyperthermus butylicus DSM 5456]ABM80319.1 30S ribosomal protein S8e [Hyperthermus butylicus DSM 5456]
MGVYHGNDLKKPTGGKKRPHQKVKRKYWMGRYPTFTRLDNRDVRVHIRVRGGNYKIRLKRAAYANVIDPETNTARKVRILRVVETPANPHYARANIIVKGTIIETELGKAVVTSRPGQDGVINAVLIEKRSERPAG